MVYNNINNVSITDDYQVPYQVPGPALVSGTQGIIQNWETEDPALRVSTRTSMSFCVE